MRGYTGGEPDNRSWLADFTVRRPLTVFSVYASIGAMALVALSWHHSKDIRETTALKAAEAYSDAVSTMRSYYSKHVVPRAKKADATVSHDMTSTDTSIPFPATLTIELANQLRADGSAFSFSFYSDLPFPWRRDRRLDQFELDALSALSDGTAAKFVRFENYKGQRSVRVAYPVVMDETCIGCLNAHPDTPRAGWKAGDIRGVQQITMPIPNVGTSFLPDLRESALYVGLFALAGMFLIWRLLRELQRRIEETRALASATETKNVELAIAKGEAEQANRAQGELMANVSHELRTPLNSIIGFSEIIKDERMGAVGVPQYRGFAEEIHTGGAHLLEIINAILFMSQLDAGRAEMQQEALAVDAAIDRCVIDHAAMAAAGGVAVTVSCGGDLPNVLFDRRGLSTILDALCSNAIKFTQPGGQVLVSACLLDTGSIVVRFEDTGIGIAAEMLDEVRKPFRQADGGKARRYEGVGLGLAMATSIAKLHNCTIDIASVEKIGTTVTLAIPASRTVGRPGQDGPVTGSPQADRGASHAPAIISQG